VFFFVSVFIASTAGIYIYVAEVKPNDNDKIYDKIKDLEVHVNDLKDIYEMHLQTQRNFNDSILHIIESNANSITSLITIKALSTQNEIVREIYQISRENLHKEDVRDIMLEVIQRFTVVDADDKKVLERTPGTIRMVPSSGSSGQRTNQ